VNWLNLQECRADLYNVTKGAGDVIQENVQGCLCLKIAQPVKVSIHVNLLNKPASQHQDQCEAHQGIHQSI